MMMESKKVPELKRIFFDTEFVDTGSGIMPISIGMVDENYQEYYAVFDYDESKITPWVAKNVIPKLKVEGFKYERKTRKDIMHEILGYIGNAYIPKFYAYFASHDWVMLCDIFGGMLKMPIDYPMFVRDLKYAAAILDIDIHQPDDNAHNALDDARWLRDQYNRLYTIMQERGDLKRFKHV